MFTNESDLAAWKEDFFKDNFNVDQCLSTYTQNTDLETLRRELKQYGNELHVAMSDILKTETESIVYLAEDLRNLNSKIEYLSSPISQLEEEIRSLHEAIKSVQEGLEKNRKEIDKNKEELEQVQLQMDMLQVSVQVNNILQMEITDPDEKLIYLERAVSMFSFRKLYLRAVGIANLVIDINDVENKLLDRIEPFFCHALKQDDKAVITRCLRMYVDLCLQQKAEKFYRDTVVKPVTKNIFTQKNLEKHKQQLCKLYEEALNFLNNDMKALLEVLESKPDLKGFNFIINSFWKEADKQIRENLPNLTAPGNPDVFQRRFKETWQFFTEIAKKCNNMGLLRTDETFKEHIKRFNLPVYYEIRFQQIAYKMEEEIITYEFVYPTGTEDEFKIDITAVTWKSIKRCFDSDTFLVLLSAQFLKLSMLILSRYFNWLDSYIQGLNESSQQTEEFLICALSDLGILKSYLGNESLDIDNSIFGIFPKSTHTALLKSIKINKSLLDDHQKKLQDSLSKMKYKECMDQLSKVESIPRLYRRTNKNFPWEASGYVKSAVEILTSFNKKYKEASSTEVFQSTVDLIIKEITNQFLNHVQEVLNNVCKTEESLRRLKNRNQPISEDVGQGSTDTISDEKKIRAQIKLDIDYFVKSLSAFCYQGSREYLKKLEEISV